MAVGPGGGVFHGAGAGESARRKFRQLLVLEGVSG